MGKTTIPTGGGSKSAQRQAKAAAAARRGRQAERRRVALRWVAVAVVAVLVVGGLYLIFRSNTSDGGSAQGGPTYEVGSPGPGKVAPDFTLPSTDGGQVSLSDYRGRTVLLYFHEGGGCQPCWDQIRDLETQWGRFRDAGVDELVTITTDPVDLVAQKMRDDGLSSVALSDPDLAVSKRYTTNQYGMMGETRNGHSFILVGPDGRIRWRADYGGAPEYTMYVAVDDLLADLKAGRRT